MMTDVFDFNDPSELNHGVSIAAGHLRAASTGVRKEVQDFSARFDCLADSDLDRSAHYFACCFSEESDDLGQWRAYADNGRGFMLEFKTNLLEKLPITSSFRVSYCDSTLSAIHKAIAESACQLISALHSKGMHQA